MQPLAWPSLQNLLEGAALWFGYLAFLFVATKLLPGKRVEGAPLADGARLSYRLNGLTAFLLSCALLCAAQLAGYSLSFVTRHFVSLWIWANVFAFGASAALYLAGRNKPGAKRHGGFLGDYYYGVELNPRLWGVDIKMFSYVPSLAGLWILNASFGFTQLELHGAISQPMLLYLLFTCIYVFNYFQFETGMLYTWDVMSESFGWMLVWGDYAFVPFCYSVAGWYLVDRTEPLPTWALVLLPVAVAPVVLRMAGVVYLFGALLLGLAFLEFARRAAARRTKLDARRLLHASVAYLPLLFGLLMLDKR